ncbi:MAG: hypothetical protein ACTSSH_00400 [Candidatus Heimdallarchaeota archaeon]
MQRCYICGLPAEHACDKCGKRICLQHRKLVVKDKEHNVAEELCTNCYKKDFLWGLLLAVIAIPIIIAVSLIIYFKVRDNIPSLWDMLNLFMHFLTNRFF